MGLVLCGGLTPAADGALPCGGGASEAAPKGILSSVDLAAGGAAAVTWQEWLGGMSLVTTIKGLRVAGPCR